jgi:hypothetical protein
MSGNSFSNISGAFGGAGQALQQGFDWKMRQQIEDMKDVRAENLTRMKFGLESQHAEHMLERTEAGANIRASAAIQGQKETTERQFQLQQTGNENYMTRMLTAQSAERERQEGRESALDNRQRQGQIAANRLEMQRALQQHDQQKMQLQQEISRAVQGRPDLSMIDDPTKKQAAMASDPVIGPMLDQLGAIDKQRASTSTAYTLYGAQLGDPMFQGKQTSELDKSSGGGGPPQLAAPGGGGAATPNNPLDKQCTRYR